MKVAYLQAAHASCNVVQRTWNDRNPNSADLKDSREGWTAYQEGQARHQAWKRHKEVYKIKSGMWMCTKQTSSRATPQAKKRIHARSKVQGQDVKLSIDSGASWHVMGESCLSAGTEKHTKDQQLPGDPNRNTSRSSALVREVGGRFALGIVSEVFSLATM